MYLSTEFSGHLVAQGTIRKFTVHNTPEYKGTAERLNRTILEKVHAMLHASGLPRNLWGEAVKHAVWLKNRTSTCSLLGNVTPYELAFEMRPDMSGLHTFGTKV
jgi:hypothetical protein